MQKHMIFKAALLSSFAAVASVTACSSSSTTPASTGDAGTVAQDSGSSTTASIAITAPANNGTLALAGGLGNITFTASNFTLKAPGSCGAGAVNCGHVHVLIDGTACNDTASGAPYNIAANASPAAANFSLCTTADGPHTVVLELHNDDHSPYLGADGKVVSATISITTSG